MTTIKRLIDSNDFVPFLEVDGRRIDTWHPDFQKYKQMSEQTSKEDPKVYLAE